ncbi:MAG TPA: glycosyl transferase family 1 [Dongiaceae bacterium]|nr:glycosyl transferase family 1 [Dongiaceae bacterium]
MSISYLVHDLNDPAVARRAAMLQQGGAVLDLLGFRRGSQAPDRVAGLPVRDLGETQDGRFIARILSIVKARFQAGNWGRIFEEGDSILARNLEMLYLAAAARRRFAPANPMFYELLDIHRLMVGDGAPARLLRRLEGALLRQCAGVIVSSPAFERDYLRRYYRHLPPVLLWENKVMPPALMGGREKTANAALSLPAPPPAKAPWCIGWFGAIRCRRSLLCLAAIARQYPGLIEVDIRGRVTEAMGADFQQIVDATPGMNYFGPYRYPDDLAAIYGQVHFVWAIDFYEAGFNSTWLLPNRLYEGGYCRRVPIALGTVETGRWLARHGLGFQLGEDLETAAETLFRTMTPARYQAALAASEAADLSLFCLNEAACETMAAALQG